MAILMNELSFDGRTLVRIEVHSDKVWIIDAVCIVIRVIPSIFSFHPQSHGKPRLSDTCAECKTFKAGLLYHSVAELIIQHFKWY